MRKIKKVSAVLTGVGLAALMSVSAFAGGRDHGNWHFVDSETSSRVAQNEDFGYKRNKTEMKQGNPFDEIRKRIYSFEDFETRENLEVLLDELERAIVMEEEAAAKDNREASHECHCGREKETKQEYGDSYYPERRERRAPERRRDPRREKYEAYSDYWHYGPEMYDYYDDDMYDYYDDDWYGYDDDWYEHHDGGWYGYDDDWYGYYDDDWYGYDGYPYYDTWEDQSQDGHMEESKNDSYSYQDEQVKEDSRVKEDKQDSDKPEDRQDKKSDSEKDDKKNNVKANIPEDDKKQKNNYDT